MGTNDLLNAAKILRHLEKIPHVNAREYYKIRGQVNACTQAIRLWLACGRKGSLYLTESLSEIFKALSKDPVFVSDSTPFQLSLHCRSLPESLQSDALYPFCQFAGDALRCHLLLLRKFIEKENILIPASALSEDDNLPAYPRYDEWLLAAMDTPRQDKSHEPALADKLQGESKIDIKKIIAAAERRELENRAIDAYFSGVCPICGELLTLKSSYLKKRRGISPLL